MLSLVVAITRHSVPETMTGNVGVCPTSVRLLIYALVRVTVWSVGYTGKSERIGNMTTELKVMPQIITKNLFGLSRSKGDWVLLTPILMDDISKLEAIVNDIFDTIDQGGRHVSFWTLMFKPDEFSAFRIE